MSTNVTKMRVKGVVYNLNKLYDELGDNTDGGLTQKAASEEIFKLNSNIFGLSTKSVTATKGQRYLVDGFSTSAKYALSAHFSPGTYNLIVNDSTPSKFIYKLVYYISDTTGEQIGTSDYDSFTNRNFSNSFYINFQKRDDTAFSDEDITSLQNIFKIQLVNQSINERIENVNLKFASIIDSVSDDIAKIDFDVNGKHLFSLRCTVGYEFNASGINANAKRIMTQKFESGNYEIQNDGTYQYSIFQYVSDSEGIKKYENQTGNRQFTINADFYISFRKIADSVEQNLTENDIQSINNTFSITQLKGGNTLTDNSTVNDFIENLYITGATANDNLYISNYGVSSGKFQIVIKKANETVCRIYNDENVTESGQVYQLETRSQGIGGYIVFKSSSIAYNTTAVNIPLKEAAFNLNSNDVIHKYILDGIQDEIDSLIMSDEHATYVDVSNATTANAIYEHLIEIYLPDYEDGWGLYSLRCSKPEKVIPESGDATADIASWRVGIKDASGNVICMYGDDYALDSYSNRIVTLYRSNPTEYSSNNIVGYAVLKYTGSSYSFTLSGTNKYLFNANVADLDKSPRLKEYLNRSENIVLLGDSTFGYKTANVLKTYLADFSGKKVFNCGFSGCRASIRSDVGSSLNKWDYTSLVKLSDYITDEMLQDETRYSDIFNVIITELTSYKYFLNRLADLMEVDWSKPTTVFINYCSNDLTGNVPVGDYWTYDADNETVVEFNVRTLLGAINYGISKLMSKYPHIRIVYMTPGWRMKGNVVSDEGETSGTLVPPYLYKNNNNVGDYDVADAIIENCKRIGISVYDRLRNLGRSYYNCHNPKSILLDNSHFNVIGYERFAKALARLDDSFII